MGVPWAHRVQGEHSRQGKVKKVCVAGFILSEPSKIAKGFCLFLMDYFFFFSEQFLSGSVG